MRLLALILALLIAASTAQLANAEPRYPFAEQVGLKPANAETLQSRFAPPSGFARQSAEAGSFAEWLRGLPLKSKDAPVLTYTGAPKWRQDVHAAVVDIDIGKRDLQQCADAIMRLRAEWLYGANRFGDIAFNDTDGKRRRFSAQSKKDYPAFRKYMDVVFAYAGTWSLERELKPVQPADLQAGDVFIKGGFPGHAVLVADVAINPQTGEKRFLLLQSFMPAQSIHVLKNLEAPDQSAWFSVPTTAPFETPEWTFQPGALRRWP